MDRGTDAHALDLDGLPAGVLRLDADGVVVAANDWVERWAGCPVTGSRLDALMVPAGDFLDGVERSVMMVHPADPAKALLVARTEGPDGATLTMIDASDRLEAGRRLRRMHALADRTQTRLQLVIDASIAFAEATTEERLGEILAVTTRQAYRAEESIVVLLGDDGRLRRAAGTNPFDALIDEDEVIDEMRALDRVVKISGADAAAGMSPRLARAMRDTGVEALIAAPLRLDDANSGVFACFFRHPREFDDEAAPLADALAVQAAQALATIRLQRTLEHAAMHDDATGLPNRRQIEERASLPGGSVTVIFLDLDGFKRVNDEMGHQRGDAVLREVGRRLQSVVREGDIVARYGGDEFIVICDGADADLAAEIADRLRMAVAAPYEFLPDGMSLAASVGVAHAVAPAGQEPIDRLIREADQAMYAAKNAGGNRVMQLL